MGLPKLDHAMILFTCMVLGQLNTQVKNASLCMLDYTNNYFALFNLWVAYIQLLVAKLAGEEIESMGSPGGIV